MRKPLASRTEVAEYLGVPPATLAGWAYRSEGPPYTRVGRYTRYRWEDVDRWLDERRHGGVAAAS